MFKSILGSQSKQPAKTSFSGPVAGAQPAKPHPVNEPFETSKRYIDLKVWMHEKLLDEMNLAAIDKMDPDTFRNEVGEIIKEILGKEQIPLNTSERNRLVSDITDEVLGLGPLEPLLKDPSVNDILVNGHASVFVERRGVLEHTEVRFKDDKHLLRIIDKIVSAIGRRVDESQPLVDARLADGSRVNAVIAPITLDGPSLSIRKFSKIPIDIHKLIELGALTEDAAQVLAAVVKARLNLLISGGTGTGKTTALNAMSSFISPKERIVTIEDAAELQLQQPHVVRLETRPPNIEGKGEIAQRELVKNALRMRPDRIIVGEIRGGEAFDMLQAMNTGHDGSMTTVHANTPRDALSRLEQMIMMSGLDLPMRAMRQQISSAIDIVLQLQRFNDGSRRITSVTEVTGMEGEVIAMQEIYRFRQTGLDAQGKVVGHFESTGVRPNFMDILEARGITISPELLQTALVA